MALRLLSLKLSRKFNMNVKGTVVEPRENRRMPLHLQRHCCGNEMDFIVSIVNDHNKLTQKVLFWFRSSLPDAIPAKAEIQKVGPGSEESELPLMVVTRIEKRKEGKTLGE